MKNSNLIVRLLNNLKPKDNRDVVITFHNIIPDDFEWFKNSINFIEKKFEIMDPKDIFLKKNRSRKRVLITFDDGLLP